jgi:hypothetical protein
MKALNAFFIVTGIILLFSCNKNNDEVQPDKEYLYIINLQADRILSYQKYNGAGDSLLEEATYQYLDDQVVKILYQGNTIKRRAVYLLESGTAKECYDTVFQNNTASDIYHHIYSHAGGKLVKDEFENKFKNGSSWSNYNWVYEYT